MTARDSSTSNTQHTAGTTRTVRDPVCGMHIDPDAAAGKFAYAGQTYFFCHSGCLERFRADPARFLLSAPSPPARRVEGKVKVAAACSEHSEGYTCPMDPEVRETAPGPCPKCGMALEPVTPAAPISKAEYVCPMHPEIVRPEPGACPICGMALEPRGIAGLVDQENPELADMTRRFW